MIQKNETPQPNLSHWQVQTLIGAIGSEKGFDVWIPLSDRGRCDWSITRRFEFRSDLPPAYERVIKVLQEVDVLWLSKGANEVSNLFEVEHSTPIYSALLRFNDVHLAVPRLLAKFNVVANDERQSMFARQVNRPTFRASGLSDRCSFMDYRDVYLWHQRLVGA